MALQISTPVKHPKAEGYNCLVDNDWFRTIANSEVKVQIGTRDSLAQRTDQQGSIYNNVLDIGYAWGRTDLSGGEGLDWDPREIALDTNQTSLDPIRYWDSNGIDIRRPDDEGDQYALKLARALKEWEGQPAFTDLKDIAVSENFIFVLDSLEVSIFNGWDDLTPALVVPVPDLSEGISIAASPTGTIMVCANNGNVYAMRYPFETTLTLVYGDAGNQKLSAVGVWYVQGRFLISAFDSITSAELFAMEWDGAAWLPEISVDTGQGFVLSVVESGPAVVAAWTDGTLRTYTANNAVDGDMGLIPKGRITLPHGESPMLLGSNGNILLVQTTADQEAPDRQTIRVYSAEVLDARFDFIVGQLQLKRQWLGAEHEKLVTRNMTNSRDEIFFFVKEELEGVLIEALWRYDLVTTGMSRIVTVPNVNYNGLVLFDNILGVIDFTDNVIDISDPVQLQSEGYMIFPNITFGMNTPISWLTTVLEAHDLEGTGAHVELWRSTDPTAILDRNDPSWVVAQRLSSSGGASVEAPLVGISSRTLSLQLKVFAREGGTLTPKITRTAIRGIPRHRDFIALVPINISDYVSVPGRRPTRVPGLGHSLHEKMLDLVGGSVNMTLIDPPYRMSGVVNNISEPIEYLSPRGSVTRYCVVEFRGERSIQVGNVPTGDSGVGLGLLGIAIVGIGQTGGT